MDDLCGGGFLTILVIVGAFFVFREVVCWYWKLNELVRLQEAQLTALQGLLAEVKALRAESIPPEEVLSATPFDTEEP